MKCFICQSCGHIAFGEKPEKCPVCFTVKFENNDNIFRESQEKSGEAAAKHIPAVSVNTSCSYIPENDCTDVMVRIGEVLHPMQEQHFIRFIDCYCDYRYLGRMYLTPGMNPAACFHLTDSGKKITVVENCSIHGYWMTEKER